MKPNFALDLSHDGIGLLHRGVDGWHPVGNVSLEDTEFGDKLGFLRQTAAALESSGVTTKLVIPNSQILFTTIDAAAGTPSESERHSQIRAALEGATPYEIDDLVFDWTEVDGIVQVAAVARETLAEAEGFATEYGFNPVSFVANPTAGTFTGTEPFFGTSTYSKSLLDSTDPVERDAEIIRILGPGIAPDQPVPPAQEDIHEDSQKPDTAPKPDAKSETEPDPASDAEPEPKSEPESKPKPEQTPPPPVEDEAVKPAGETLTPPANVTSPQLPELEEQTPDTPMPAFASRRQGNTDTDDGQALDRIENIESRLVILPEGTTSLAPKLGGASRKLAKPTAEPTPPPAAKPAAKPVTPPAPPVSPLTETTPAPSTAAHQADIPIPASPIPASPIPAQIPLIPDVVSEEQAMTVFGARKKPVQAGKPRYLGLILMLVLLAVLGAIVLWSTFFLSDKVTFWRNDQTDTITTPAQAQADATGNAAGNAVGNAAVNEAVAMLTAPSIRHDIQPSTITPPAPLTMVAPQIEQITSPPPLPALPPAPRPDTPPPLTPEAAQTAYLNTGIWQRAPKAPLPVIEGEIKSLYITSVDPHIASQDAIALPKFPSSSDDSPLDLQTSPAAHSTAFVLDERGLVIPSVEGTMTPDGVLVFAGPPPIKPRARGNRVPQVLIEPDLRLAAFRPQARPADLVQQTETVQETEQLGGYTRRQLATLRPKPRPYEMRPPQNATEPEVPEDAVATVMPQGPVSDLAVVLSSAPRHRPRNFARLVERARASAPTERATAATAVPRNQTVAPSAPTRASVARLATTKNAINLRRTSLIGVYGSPSKRRALVRLSNGRYVKVQVGQRVDGGKVAAIGQSELRYVKGGRTIILRMPKS